MKLNDNTRIKWVDYGIANVLNYNNHGCSNKVIEINKNLIDYPRVFRETLKHELNHSSAKFSLHDLSNDIQSLINIYPNLFEKFRFTLEHPRSLAQLSPVWYRKRDGFIFDINLGIVWGVMLSIIGIILIKVF